ncbi:MAG: DUF402 domain-containing protein [Promethearchaeia archaeon]
MYSSRKEIMPLLPLRKILVIIALTISQKEKDFNINTPLEFTRKGVRNVDLEIDVVENAEKIKKNS